jgi:DNA gyrase/topoisomerase IV subunit B
LGNSAFTAYKNAGKRFLLVQSKPFYKREGRKADRGRGDKMKGRQQLRKEHVHFKPETYIGSYSEVHERTWIIENGKVALKTIAFIPAVLNLVEELIANAIQHGSRHPEAPIQLSINEGGTVTVTNEGLINLNDNAVPTVQHLLAVFGEEEIGSELYRRGRGAKLVNMFCRNFYVEMGSH